MASGENSKDEVLIASVSPLKVTDRDGIASGLWSQTHVAKNRTKISASGFRVHYVFDISAMIIKTTPERAGNQLQSVL